ncbi:MAG: sigma-70 family RNA polymerase sigma factor [Oscillospiraceae bacterium]|nr:sigma-70 family RNA polymerase sigma factor [Oscillospiraceae bacterium]
MEDAAIVDLYWQRSDRALSETDKKYGRYCQSIAYHICGAREDAEECVNDTYLRAWNRMPTERPAALGAFLGRITRNLALDRIKARNTVKRGGGQAPLALSELEDCIPGGTSPERALEEKELEAVIGRFVAALPKTEKMVFVLRYFYLAPVDEIAEKLHFSSGKVKSMLFRSRKKLRSALEKEGLA